MAMALTSGSVKITWEQSSAVTGYLIIAAENGNIREERTRNAPYILKDLKDNTVYTITVQAIYSDGKMSAHSNEASVRTFAAGKYVARYKYAAR